MKWVKSVKSKHTPPKKAKRAADEGISDRAKERLERVLARLPAAKER
jgi:hypothetical protein